MEFLNGPEPNHRYKRRPDLQRNYTRNMRALPGGIIHRAFYCPEKAAHEPIPNHPFYTAPYPGCAGVYADPANRRRAAGQPANPGAHPPGSPQAGRGSRCYTTANNGPLPHHNPSTDNLQRDSGSPKRAGVPWRVMCGRGLANCGRDNHHHPAHNRMGIHPGRLD